MATRSGKSKQYEKHVEAISKVSQSITSNLYLEDILKLIVTVTAEIMDSKICSLMLIDEKSGKLVLKATQSMDELYNRKPPLKIGEGVAGKVAMTNKPRAVFNIAEETDYLSKDIAEKIGLHSLLAVPLTVKGKVIGVLNNYTSHPHRFTNYEIDIMTTVASQAAIVIENAALMMKTKVIQDELESRKAVERAKGILMRQQGITEEEAFRKIQKQSMDMRKSMREIAEAIILIEKMKK